MPNLRLPTVEQIVMAPERPTLAALDTLLDLAARSLLAENPGLTQKPYARPFRPDADARVDAPQLALAASALTLASALREVIGAYLAHLDRIYGDGQAEVDVDDDMPF